MDAWATYEEDLDLSGLNLTAIPELAFLHNLKRLNLSGNNLSRLPESLDQLCNLRSLSLRGNQLSSLPESLGRLTSLERLDLSKNKLRRLPETLGQLKELRFLNLHENQLFELPYSLQTLPSLESLFLHENQDLGIPAEILGPQFDAGRFHANPSGILGYYFGQKGALSRKRQFNVKSANLAVFVDGQNFITTLESMFPTEFNREDYLPRNADWDRMFRALGALVEADWWMVNWYTIKELDFVPYINWGTENLDEMHLDSFAEWKNRIRYSNPKLEADLNAQPSNEKRRELMMSHRRRLFDQEQKMKARMEEWSQLQDAVSIQCPNVTIRRTGWQAFHLAEGRPDTPKGVDVGLAVDMVTMGDLYDTAIIFSGNGNYLPAVEAMKLRGKQIGVVDFRYRNGLPLGGTARRLAEAADFRLEINFHDMAEFMRIEI